MTANVVIKRLLKLGVFLMVFVSVSSFSDVPHNLQKVGQGTMSWFFMDIYQATLFSEDGKYQPLQYPQALTIKYQRDISQDALLKATQKQWQYLSIDVELYQDWLQQLGQLWPDIKEGDQLTFWIAQNGEGDFYHNDKWLGHIEERELSDAFLSIWLSPKTSEPKLRRKLIGDDK